MKSFILFAFFIVNLSMAQEGGRVVEPRGIDVDVHIPDRNVGPKGEGGNGNGGSNSGGSSARGRSASSSTTLNPQEQQIFISSTGQFQYEIYGTLDGYSYGGSPGQQQIEAHVPIDLFSTEVTKNEKGTGTGLGKQSRDMLGQIGGSLRASGNDKATKVANELDKLRTRDEKAEKARLDAHQKLLSSTTDKYQNEINKVIQKAHQAFSEKTFNGQVTSPELESAQAFTSFHLAMAKQLSSPYSNVSIGLGKKFALEVSKEMLDTAGQAIDFVRGSAHGTEVVVVQTVNGTKVIVKEFFEGITNPVETMDKIYSIMQNIDPAGVADVFAQTIASRMHQLNSGNAYLQGQAIAEIVTNFVLAFMPFGSPIPTRIVQRASQTALSRNILSVARSLGHLSQSQAYTIAKLFSSTKGTSIGSGLISAARRAGHNSFQQLHNFGMFARQALRNQVGTVGDISASLFQEYSAYFRSFPSNGVVTRVISADELNAKLIAQGRKAAYQNGTYVTIVKILHKETYVRVHGPNNMIGRWLVKESEIINMTPQQIKDYLNIKDIPTSISKIDIPSGEEVRVSRIGKNEFGLDEGGTQVELLRDPKSTEFYGTEEL